MALAHSPSITRTGLRLWLDAANTKSYPGSGTAFIYNRALTAQEVAQNFNSTRSRFGV